MTDTTIAGQPSKPAMGRLESQLLAALAVTAIADWLFFGHAFGVSCIVFALAVCAATIATNPLPNRRDVAIATAVLSVSLVPLIETANLITMIFGIAGTAVFALLSTGHHAANLRGSAQRLASIMLIGPLHLVPDILRLRRTATRSRHAQKSLGLFAAWLLPLAFGVVFALLFASANPLIEDFITSLDPGVLFDHISPVRIGFWLIAASASWPFIRVRLRHRRARKKPHFNPPVAAEQVSGDTAGIPAPPVEPVTALAFLFNRAAVLRSLVLFNGLFAAQTAMDLAYLWGGLELPDGMTYAQYAHRGAYPLIATALLAGVFVLIAMRPGAETERLPMIRILVFAWIAQNVLLVVSSILRLDLYVEVYALTYLRVAAFVWMFMVIVGLVLIVARIALNRSNAWMVSANLINLVLVLYACGFVNFTNVIASYNVEHSRELSGRGIVLDQHYLASLGPQAIPAIDEFLARIGKIDYPRLFLLDCRHMLAAEHKQAMQSNWRAWSYRGARLSSYLDDQGIVRMAHNDHAASSNNCRRVLYATMHSGRR